MRNNGQFDLTPAETEAVNEVFQLIQTAGLNKSVFEKILKTLTSGGINVLLNRLSLKQQALYRDLFRKMSLNIST